MSFWLAGMQKRRASTSGLGAIATEPFGADAANVCYSPIALQKSYCTYDQRF